MRELLAARRKTAGWPRSSALLLPGKEVDRRVAVALGGLETLAFSAGIGGRSAPVRARIVKDFCTFCASSCTRFAMSRMPP